MPRDVHCHNPVSGSRNSTRTQESSNGCSLLTSFLRIRCKDHRRSFAGPSASRTDVYLLPIPIPRVSISGQSGDFLVTRLFSIRSQEIEVQNLTEPLSRSMGTKTTSNLGLDPIASLANWANLPCSGDIQRRSKKGGYWQCAKHRLI